MTAPEVRAGPEFRMSGRTLTGTVLRYGDTSPEHRERFLPGAFAPVPPVPLNIQHDPSMVVLDAGAYVLTDTERSLEIRAELPAGSAALKLVQRGALNGFSVEFHSRRESRNHGERVIAQAELVGVGLVDEPSYPGSLAEVRRRGDQGGRLGTFRGRVPAGAGTRLPVLPGRLHRGPVRNRRFRWRARGGPGPGHPRNCWGVRGRYRLCEPRRLAILEGRERCP